MIDIPLWLLCLLHFMHFIFHLLTISMHKESPNALFQASEHPPIRSRLIWMIICYFNWIQFLCFFIIRVSLQLHLITIIKYKILKNSESFEREKISPCDTHFQAENGFKLIKMHFCDDCENAPFILINLYYYHAQWGNTPMKILLKSTFCEIIKNIIILL